MSNPHPKTTLWLWPTGLFPRRIIYYFLAKNITTSTVVSHNIHLIPITLSPTHGLVSAPGFEARPAGTSLPVLRIAHDDGQEFWIRESLAIIEYFEEIFSVGEGWRDIRGESVEQRARARDVLSLLGDATIWGAVESIHSDTRTLSWSGLSEEGMSKSAAEDARRRTRALLEKLEGWVEEGEGGKSLAGKGGNVTVADIALMAHVEYVREMYGAEWVEGHGVLVRWWKGMKGEKWVVGREKLKEVEEGGKWSHVLG